MAVWDRKILWSFVFLLAGAVGQSVNYPDPVCAVKGSTVTLPCTFTPKSVIQDGREVSIEIIRVVWCQNHAICQLTTPSVYDSESNNNRPRYKYLGDKKGNCTLQISDLQEDDDATLRFRMEATNVRGHYTGQSGVKLTVTDWTRMEINSCSGDREVRRGETVTLCCTADCTVHPLEITWFRDGHALSESGPALQLGPLTPGDSGNYTCSLKTNFSTLSPPYSVHVEAEEEGERSSVALIAGVASGVLLALFTVIMVVCIIKRKRAAAGDKDQGAAGADVEQNTSGASRGRRRLQLGRQPRLKCRLIPTHGIPLNRREVPADSMTTGRPGSPFVFIW
ncbi:uncharacterized protein LOC122881075 isoform X3 [Siniperca chuatsi]|uniref:uncharacterized protein LOC122881075 isoform X3 n=1 Tax=Siniperca chuatsi TaxID=119488 RepID=UPI001CE2098C|nr:uncharacterized protein LOC122881075 isoform X3 [Siniperca chuatsi]